MKFFVLSALLVGACASRRSSWANLANEVKNGFVQQGLRGDRADPASTLEKELFKPPKDVEISDDYNKQTKIEVADHSLPFSIEAFVAALWCLMIATIPFVITKYAEHEVTLLIKVEGVLLLVWLVGGITAFTQVILFQSAHFDGIRPLTMVESTYLLTQILTTIGYGDITPAFPRGQVVCAFYILLSILIVGNMFSQVVEVIQRHMAEAVESSGGDFAFKEDEKVVRERLELSEAELQAEANKVEAPQRFEWVEEPTAEGMPVLKAFCTYASVAFVGVLFFHLYPGENKTWMEAIYMSIVTLSTVGFGAFTATTEVGKAFASFWMLVGVAALGHFVSACVEWSLKKKSVDANTPQQVDLSWNALMANMDVNGDGSVSSEEFLKFALVHAGYTSEEQIEKIAHFFRKMHPDSKGLVPLTKFTALGEPEVIRTPRSGRAGRK